MVCCFEHVLALTTKETKALLTVLKFNYFENKSLQKNKNQRFFKTYVYFLTE